MGETVRFGVSLSAELLERFDRLIARMGYENRSEAIRDLIREKLVQQEWEAPKAETFAVVLLVYDHHAMSVDRRLIDAQHRSHSRVVSTMHVHLDEENCLEIVVLKGPGQAIRALGEKLISMRGVKYGKINLGAPARELA